MKYDWETFTHIMNNKIYSMETELLETVSKCYPRYLHYKYVCNSLIYLSSFIKVFYEVSGTFKLKDEVS